MCNGAPFTVEKISGGRGSGVGDNHIKIGNRTRLDAVFFRQHYYFPVPLFPECFYILGHPAAGVSYSITKA